MNLNFLSRSDHSAILLRTLMLPLLASGALAEPPTPRFTHSPDGRYGVSLFSPPAPPLIRSDRRRNQVIDLRTKRPVLTIEASPGYDRALNYRETLAPRWSADSSALLWTVAEKWFPAALVLVKIGPDDTSWQLDLMKAGQEAILERTRRSAPDRYATASAANAGNGSAYPYGFTVGIYCPGKQLAFPVPVRVNLTANPKQREDFPVTLDAHLDAVVTADGKLVVTSFKLGPRSR